MLHFQQHSLRMTTKAHLVQTMSLVSFSTMELQQYVQSQLSQNPALEMVEERRCPVCRRLLPARGLCSICTRSKSSDGDEPIVFISQRGEWDTPYRANFGDVWADGEESDRDLKEAVSLAEHVLRQIAPMLDSKERILAAYWLNHLDEDGLVDLSLEEVAWYHHVPVEQVLKVKRLIQQSDPIGVGSATPKEALLVQLNVLGDEGNGGILARRLIEDGWEMLGRRLYVQLAQQFGCSAEEVERSAFYIGQKLNPFPGRASWGDNLGGHRPVNVYHLPDIICSVNELNGGAQLMIEIVHPLAGTLRINPLYKQVVKQVDGEQQDEMRADLERASLLIKCLKQRNHTLQGMMKILAVEDREFLLHDETKLKPLTRFCLAKRLGVHPSTISRAVANKVLQLPNGRMVPLSNLFVHSLGVRSVLREVIENELRPLSDAELVEKLAEQGIYVARRTVAKYRRLEGILSAALRGAMKGGAV